MCGSTEACLGSACVDATASCAVIQSIDSTKPSGLYTHDGTSFYCDMSTMPPVQYDQLAVGKYTGAYNGMTLLTGAMLADPKLQQAFIALYNVQSGPIALETWNVGNVCITTAAGGGLRMAWGGSILFGPGAPIMGSAAPLTRSGQAVPLPLPLDYFTTMPASDTPGCGDGENPALYLAIR
jgi:hypothetical protein